MKKILLAGNWKMNTNLNEAIELADGIRLRLLNKKLNSKILICPPFINLISVYRVVKDSGILLGAQNCYYEDKGAFTGEISLNMLATIKCNFVIIGHSERRTIFGETDELINKKVTSVLNSSIAPILCIGETLEERQSGKTFDVLEKQIKTGLMNIASEKLKKLVIAYEPVWAIGTGLNASNQQIDEAHEFIKKQLVNSFGTTAEDILLLYGGSVNAENAEEILSLKNVNGALIGGASLKVDSFISIIESAERILS